MTEATEKQIKFASSLGIDNPSQFTKEALKELIAVEVDKREDKIDSTPQKPGKVDESGPNSKDDTIIREVALKCAVEMTEGAANPEKVLEIADRFVDWIKA